ncbi:MAG: hemolysin family protein [Actinomycetaceae bacterium]|nr:hemolysin family protein [Actinomycetaceae bacterium]MDY6142929.1 hemolysin family protein [Arcanobacterium sp.]
MIDASDIPLLGLGIVAIACLVIISYCTVVLSALNRITRAETAQAIAQEQAGVRVGMIVDRRIAALSATMATRGVVIGVLAICVALLLAPVVERVWLLAIVAALCMVALVSAILVISPTELGRKYPIAVIRSVNLPLWLVTRISSIFVTTREPETPDARESQQEDQLAVMVERVSESDVVEDDERLLLRSVFELSRTLVREVMVPRTDMISIHADTSLDKALSLFSRSGFSRVPVIGESVDDLRGVLYLKDVIRRVHHRIDAENLRVEAVMRSPEFVPETKAVDDLLQDMQARAVHIAMVVDEYGGIAGLVTIEDLLEELVGEMVDEHDRAMPEIEALDDDSYRVPARLPLDELGELFGITIDDDDVETAGGLLTKGLGRLPISGSQTQIAGLRLEADRFGGRRKQLSTVIASRVDDQE